MNGSIVRPNTWDKTIQGVGVGSALLFVLCEARAPLGAIYDWIDGSGVASIIEGAGSAIITLD